MSRTRQLAIAMGLLVVAAFACAAIIHLLIAPRLSTLFNLKAPTDALLTLDDVGPGFEMRNEFTSSIGVETEVNRHFDATGEASDSDALSIESSAAAYRLAMEDPDDYINLRLGTVAFFTRGNRSIVSVEGPSMGGPTAWRASLDPDAEDPIDWTIVAFRRANTWIM
ncbi:MAG: hypothetical protein QOF51_1784, partial [Chloroflexota bacterium]|nr:hypothetical protein [Chloroflexota bacterium]